VRKVRALLDEPGWRERVAAMRRVFERYEAEQPEVAIFESFLPRS